MGIYYNELLNNFEKTPKTLENGAIIGEVCHINQSTIPTTRPDGSTLFIGDTWHDTLNLKKAFWNGLNWVGEQFLLVSPKVNILTTAQEALIITLPFNTNRLLLERVGIGLRRENGTYDASNYWTIRLGTRTNGSNVTFFTPDVNFVLNGTNINLIPTFFSYYETQTINQILEITASGHRAIQLASITQTGVPPSLMDIGYWVKCREVYS